MKNIQLEEMLGGALQEQFSRSFEKVVENLQNPNTPFKNAREIIIKLKFTQNEKRDDVKCSVSVSEKLAPQATMETAFAVGKNLETGELFAEEYGKQLKGQISFSDSEQAQKNIVVDVQTGEVLKETVSHSNVVDLRKAASFR